MILNSSNDSLMLDGLLDGSIEAIEDPENLITTVREFTLSNLPNLKNVNLPALQFAPDNKDPVYWNILNGCPQLENVSMPLLDPGVALYFHDYTNLKSVNIARYTNFSYNMFRNCINLEEIITSNAQDYGEACFENCIKINESVIDINEANTISYSAFRGTGITEIHINNASLIRSSAFRDCKSLTKAYVKSDSLIGGYVFRDCTNLVEVELNLPHDIDATHKELFYGCKSLKTVKGLDLFAAIPESCFYESGITKIVANNVTTVYAFAFMNSELKELDLPKVNSFESSSFRGSDSLTKLILRGTEQVVTYKSSSSSLDPKNAYLKIYVPRALLSSYVTATNWSRLASKFVALEDYTVDGTTTGELIT